MMIEELAFCFNEVRFEAIELVQDVTEKLSLSLHNAIAPCHTCSELDAKGFCRRVGEFLLSGYAMYDWSQRCSVFEAGRRKKAGKVQYLHKEAIVYFVLYVASMALLGLSLISNAPIILLYFFTVGLLAFWIAVMAETDANRLGGR